MEGVSTRRVDDLVKALGCDGISKSQVSRICRDLDRWLEREGIPHVLAIRSNEKLWVWTDQGLCQVRADRLTSQVDEPDAVRAMGPRGHGSTMGRRGNTASWGAGQGLLAAGPAQPRGVGLRMLRPGRNGLGLVRVAGTWATRSVSRRPRGRWDWTSMRCGGGRLVTSPWRCWRRHLSVIKHQAMEPGEKGAATVPMKR